MKSILKSIIFSSLLVFAQQVTFAQDADKTVTLVVSGQGKSQDEAKQKALRSAIEQAFGAFISSKTEILNDNLVKDEIVSVANGNIQKFEIISEVQIPNGGYATSLKATVSVTKLTSFVESKGFEVEFKGSLFGANLKQQRMNEDAEWKSIINICEVSNKILSNSIDYSIEVGEPVKASNMRGFNAQPNDYQILFTIKLSPNNNFDKFVNYFYSNIKAIAMPVPEQDDYFKLNKTIYYLNLRLNEKSIEERYFFRNPNTVIALQNLFLKSNKYLHNFQVISNLDTITVNKQNMYSYYNTPEMWCLNSGASSLNRSANLTTSSNNNPGYPQFNFNYGAKLSSWRTYFEYLNGLTNYKILFDSNNYFTQTGSFYIKNGGGPNDTWGSTFPQHPYDQYPGSNPSFSDYPNNIGEINLLKINYYCKYLAIYSEEEISKITNISVNQFKKF